MLIYVPFFLELGRKWSFLFAFRPHSSKELPSVLRDNKFGRVVTTRDRLANAWGSSLHEAEP